MIVYERKSIMRKKRGKRYKKRRHIDGPYGLVINIFTGIKCIYNFPEWVMITGMSWRKIGQVVIRRLRKKRRRRRSLRYSHFELDVRVRQ